MEWKPERHSQAGLLITPVYPGQKLRILSVAVAVHEAPAPPPSFASEDILLSEEAVSVYYVLQPGLPDRAAPPEWSLADDAGTGYEHSGHGEMYRRDGTVCYEDWWPLPPQEARCLR